METASMMSKTVKLSVLAAAVFCVGSAALAQEKKPAAAPAPAAAKPGEEAAKPEENKLVKLTTLEQAFLKANRDRQLLEVLILQETQKLEKAVKEEDKQAIRKTIGEARKRQHLLNTAMDVVFGVGRRRDYEYDTVKSTVYLRVGTVRKPLPAPSIPAKPCASSSGTRRLRRTRRRTPPRRPRSRSRSSRRPNSTSSSPPPCRSSSTSCPSATTRTTRRTRPST